MRNIRIRVQEIRSLTIDSQVSDLLESVGALYRGTSEHQVNGLTVAIDRYVAIAVETSVFHLQLANTSYVVFVDLPIEGDVDLAMSLLVVGICLGVPSDSLIEVAEEITMIV